MAYTTIDNSELYFQTKLYTGNGGTQAITFDGSENMQPDWVWVKDRDTSGYNHVLNDSVRGVTKYLRSNLTNAEATITDAITSFDNDGFTLGSDASNGESNRNTINYVSWNWKAGGSASSNGDGDITSSVSANTTAGFSIVSYTGNGSVGATVGHGLSSAPEMVITKDRNASYPWGVYHIGLDATSPEDKYIELDSTAPAADFNYWNDTKPSNTVVTLGSSAANTTNGNNIIMYCFHSVKGYSKFGSFTGNGNADGTFVYTGFKPAFIIEKLSSGTGSWLIYDNKRNGINGDNHYFYADGSDAELTTQLIDITSNGFKHRHAGGANSSGTSIYMAFAEAPLVNSSGIPNNAR